jgi:hypothetical protein
LTAVREVFVKRLSVDSTILFKLISLATGASETHCFICSGVNDTISFFIDQQGQNFGDDVKA